MRILQLIDSLRPGGAEKMALNIANALLPHVEGSYLCCTRQEGMLKEQLKPEVGYIFLNKRSSIDPKAILKLKKYIQENKIDIVHAHSTSYFLAGLLKLSGSNFKLIWHDHYGRELNKRKIGLLKPASKFFDGIISVNKDLKNWACKNLYNRRIKYIRNFLPETHISGEQVQLFGGNSFKVICVANLRPQKDHLNLLRAFLLVLEKAPETSLHLVGKEERTSYSVEIRNYIQQNGLQGKVFLYGEQENIPALLEQANLGVLSSISEGMPLALLEYGRAGLAVVCTDVGQCKEVLDVESGIVPSRNSLALAQAILNYREDDESRKKDAAAFKDRRSSHFSEKVVMQDLLNYFLGVLGQN